MSSGYRSISHDRTDTTYKCGYHPNAIISTFITSARTDRKHKSRPPDTEHYFRNDNIVTVWFNPAFQSSICPTYAHTHTHTYYIYTYIHTYVHIYIITYSRTSLRQTLFLKFLLNTNYVISEHHSVCCSSVHVVSQS